MISVKNADPNIRSTTNVMKLFDGPLVIEPVRIANHKTTLFTRRRQNKVQPTQAKRIHKAVSPEPAFTKATLKANSVHPTISFPIPADKTTIPTVVSKSLSSVRIRHKTGNAVMENATPANSMKCVNWTVLSMNWLYSATDKAEPRPKAARAGQFYKRYKNCFGILRIRYSRMTIPAKETVRDILALRLMTPASISSPTKNKNKERPMFATRERYGLDSLGNMWSVNPGIRPNAVGPSRIPPAR